MRLISGKMKYFHFVSIQSLVTVYVIHSEVKLIAGVISLRYFDRNKILFQVIKYHVITTRNEIN